MRKRGNNISGKLSRAERNFKFETFRLSIGTEHIDDIIEDLEEAFKALEEEAPI